MKPKNDLETQNIEIVNCQSLSSPIMRNFFRARKGEKLALVVWKYREARNENNK